MGNQQLPLVEVKDVEEILPGPGGSLQRTIGYVKAVDGVNLWSSQAKPWGGR
jgi:hypothetical protein